MTVDVVKCEWLVLMELLMYASGIRRRAGSDQGVRSTKEGATPQEAEGREVQGSGLVVAEIRRVSISFGLLRGFFRDGSVLEFWGFLVERLWFRLGGRSIGPVVVAVGLEGVLGKNLSSGNCSFAALST